jgi:hypothetical protein
MTITETASLTANARQRVTDTLAVLDHVDEHAADLDGISFYPSGDKVLVPVFSADDLARVARVLAAGAPVGTVRKIVTGDYAEVHRQFGTVDVQAYCARDEACTKRVVGTETVEVPDPDAPTITIEREVVEWDCKPILGRDEANAAAKHAGLDLTATADPSQLF